MIHYPSLPATVLGAVAAALSITVAAAQALSYPERPIRLIIPVAEADAPGLVSRRPVRGQGAQAAGFNNTSVTLAVQYPTRPIRLIVPVAPGGGNDIVARLLAQKLTAAWGQQVVVDNRPGAATAIGAEITAKANPDGYTIMLYSVSFAINASVNRNLPFDPIRDFAPITLIARVPQILIVHPAVAAKSVAELIALAKAKPGQLNYASAASGSSNHLAMELFSAMAGISLNHVPYKGTAPGLADLLAGHVQTMFDAIPPALAQVKSGRVRALAVVSPQRFPSLPELPTMAESGLPGFTFGSWFGIVAPARTPSAIIDKLNRELVRIVQLPETRERFIAMGIAPLGTTPQEFGQHLKREIAQWSEVVRQRNIRAN
jgi:tripartite-type tricarboxylate transporter receptor subunit TctC